MTEKLASSHYPTFSKHCPAPKLNSALPVGILKISEKKSQLARMIMFDLLHAMPQVLGKISTVKITRM